MQITFPTEIKIDGFSCIATLWDNAPGKERIYIATASGKDMGYVTIATGAVTITRSTWNAKGHKESFESACIAEFVPQIVVTESEPTSIGEVKIAKTVFYSVPTKTCWECGSTFTYAQCKSNDGDWNENGGYCGC